MNWELASVLLGFFVLCAWCVWCLCRMDDRAHGHQPSRKLGTGPNVARPPEYGKPPCTPHGQGTRSGYKIDPVGNWSPPPPRPPMTTGQHRTSPDYPLDTSNPPIKVGQGSRVGQKPTPKESGELPQPGDE